MILASGSMFSRRAYTLCRASISETDVLLRRVSVDKCSITSAAGRCVEKVCLDIHVQDSEIHGLEFGDLILRGACLSGSQVRDCRIGRGRVDRCRFTNCTLMLEAKTLAVAHCVLHACDLSPVKCDDISFTNTIARDCVPPLPESGWAILQRDAVIAVAAEWSGKNNYLTLWLKETLKIRKATHFVFQAAVCDVAGEMSHWPSVLAKREREKITGRLW